MENKLEKKYGLFTAICMVVGIVVGSGVFFKAQVILQKTGGDMPLGILAWLIGGTIMIVCILAFSAMAQKYEKVNGIVDYAEAIVGKRYGYYIGWFLSTTYYPTLTSALAWLSARYTLVFVTSVDPDFPLIVPAFGIYGGKSAAGKLGRLDMCRRTGQHLRHHGIDVGLIVAHASGDDAIKIVAVGDVDCVQVIAIRIVGQAFERRDGLDLLVINDAGGSGKADGGSRSSPWRKLPPRRLP